MKMSPILAIAYRDIIKFLRDRTRIVSTFVFPIVFIGILGGSLQSNIGNGLGYNLLVFTFVGVLAQTLFQSSALGIISLIEDRDNDFTQEIFVSPVSRYAIIFGKILGEASVALLQGVGILAFGFLIRVPLTLGLIVALIPVMIVACLVGGAFGVLILSTLNSQRSANQIFPFIMLPQFFLAGIFSPIKVLPLYLSVLSHLAPLRYVVDLVRGVYYTGKPEYGPAVLKPLGFNLIVLAVLFAVCIIIGTTRFVNSERNR